MMTCVIASSEKGSGVIVLGRALGRIKGRVVAGFWEGFGEVLVEGFWGKFQFRFSQ